MPASTTDSATLVGKTRQVSDSAARQRLRHAEGEPDEDKEPGDAVAAHHVMVLAGLVCVRSTFTSHREVDLADNLNLDHLNVQGQTAFYAINAGPSLNTRYRNI